MADLTQINILPSTQIQGPNAVASGTTSHAATGIASLPAGTVLQGFIINRDASGNPIVRTDTGDFPFSTNFFLKIGSEVVIRIGNTGGNAVAHLISVDGQPPEQAQNLSAFAQEPEVILDPNIGQSLTPAPLASTAPASLAAAQEAPPVVILSGTVIALPSLPAPVPGQPVAPSVPNATPLASVAPPAVSNGTQLTLKLVSISNPPAAAPAQIPEAIAAPNLTLPQVTSAFYATYARATGAIPPAAPSVAPAVAAPEAQPVSAPIANAATLPAPAQVQAAAIQLPNAQPPVSAAATVPLPNAQPPVSAVTQAAPAETAVISEQPASPAPAATNNAPLPAAPSAQPATTSSVTPITASVQGQASQQPVAAPVQTGQPPLAQATAAPVYLTTAATAANQNSTPVIASGTITASPQTEAIAPAPPGPTPPVISTPEAIASPGSELAQAAVPAEKALVSSLLQPGTAITATVLSHEATGETLLQSPLGIVRLQTSAPIPSGSTVSMQVMQAVPPAYQNVPATSAFAQQPAPMTELAQQWSSLQQIFGLLAGRSIVTGLEPDISTANPAFLSAGLQAPASGMTAQSITSSLFNFIAAVRTGNFEGWLGADTIRTLQDQGHEDVVKKAQAEFSTLARQFTQPPQPGHWQALFFPLAMEGQVHQVRIFTKRDRRQGSQQGSSNKEEDTRFVIEVGLSQLGELQMDGFVRKQEKNMQFDMVIRSALPLSESIQSDILRIYNDMGAISGYKGSLTFQAGRAFPVNPMQEIIAVHNSVVA